MISKDFISKIGLKLIVAVGIITIIIIGVFSYFSIQAQSDGLLSQAEIQANKLSETIKNSTHSSMLLNKRDEIHTIINAISQETSIREIRVLNKEGRVMFSSQNELIGQMVDKQAESCYACHTADKPLEKLPINERVRIYKIHPDSSRILGVINPIYNDESCWNSDCHAHPKEQKVLGVLDIKMDLSDVDQQIASSEFRFIIFAVIAIVALSLFIGFFVRKWIGKPVQELVKATNQVSTGNLNYTIKSLGKDELGILASSFNNMTKKLAEARMQLFQSDKMASLGRLAAGVAHEINNPLTGVLTYSSFLLKRTKGNPEFQEDLQVIVRETKRSREIVKSLLDFARQSVPKKQHANINEIIEHSISVINNQLSLKRVKLEKNLDKNIPQITVDTNQVQQVLINLLVNASDAIGKEGGEINISTDLIKLSPYGITHIKKATCPKRHDLMDSEVKIDGMPSIKLKVSSNGYTGFINLDPVYGRNHHLIPKSLEKLNVKLKDLKVVCPVCEISLIDPEKKCPECDSPIYSLEVPSQGNVEGCLSKNCDWQKWDAIDSGGQKDYLEIKISDTGCGIQKENLSKIFEPFYSTKGQKGTGLGLSVIWGIIDNHNGTIKVDSELNIGTTFTIHLPVGRN